MSWIDVIDEAEATGDLRAVYDEITKSRGKVSNIMRVHSLNPAAMQAHMNVYMTLLFGRSGLRRAERELLATVVSAVNDCAYCVHHHAEALRAYWKDDDRVRQAVEDYRLLELDERTRTMLDYAVKLTKEPATVGVEDVEAMRRAGLSDRDILDVNLITSYFNFVNRIAEGLGATFTPEEMTGYRY